MKIQAIADYMFRDARGRPARRPPAGAAGPRATLRSGGVLCRNAGVAGLERYRWPGNPPQADLGYAGRASSRTARTI